MLGRLLASRWLYVVGGGLALGLAITGRAYLGKRDELAVAEAQIKQWQSAYQTAIGALEEQRRLKREAEAARIRLAEEVEDLRVQEVQIVTKIREVWRDREIVTEVQADCAAEPMPRRVVGMLCDAAAASGGVCAMPTDPGGPADGLPDPATAG